VTTTRHEPSCEADAIGGLGSRHSTMEEPRFGLRFD
jgi:hypothetical protein